MILGLLLLLLLSTTPTIRATTTTITAKRLGPGDILILNSSTNIILCPDTTCSFHPTSTVRIQPTSQGEPVTVTVGGSAASSVLKFGVMIIQQDCILEFVHRGTWDVQSIVVNGGTLRVSGMSTNVVTIELQVQDEEASTPPGHILLDRGGQLTTKMSTPLNLPGRLDILQANSQFHAMGDLVFSASSLVTWSCSGGDDVRVCGTLFVMGSAYMAGNAHIVSDVNNPVVARKDADVAHDSLLSTVDRMGKFTKISMDDALRCSGATTSWSWSDFSLAVSTHCAAACVADTSLTTCQPPQPQPQPQSSSSNEGADSPSRSVQPSSEDKSLSFLAPSSAAVSTIETMVGGLIAVLIFVCAGSILIVVFRRRKSKKRPDPRIMISMSELVVPYKDDNE